MEILAEILLQLLGVILQFLGELVLQFVGELIFELIGRSIAEPFRRARPISPWFAAMGYALFGAVAGAISLWALPTLFITAHWLRTANLFLTPICAGMLMASVGGWRRRHNQEVIRLDTFAYGFCFALSMAIIRFVWGH
jgi:hypothetical protein